MKKSLHTIALATVVTLASLSASAAGQEANMANHQGMHTAAQDAMSDGVIKRVDRAGGKLTIQHGELKNVGMPAMTMAFKVADPTMLDKVKEGDKVHFVVEKVGGAFTVTHLVANQ